MIARLYILNKQFINLNGKLMALPKLIKVFIMNAFSQGWDRNRAIDTLGTNNNALMGGYLLAASNTVINITGILTTDTIKALTKDGLVGVVNTANTMTFTAGNKYGAFEVYRAGALIGRYCLTERQGLQIINQVTGGLSNGLLGGTTTTVWQSSNAFYCETNERGYSISGTGWVTSDGAALTVGTIIPADPANPTKCMAWVSGVQQDLQYVGKAKNSVSVVPTAFYCNNDRNWTGILFSGVITSHYVRFRGIINSALPAAYPYGTTGATTTDTRNRGFYVNGSSVRTTYPTYNSGMILYYIGVPITIEGGYSGATGVIYIKITEETTGRVTYSETTGNPASITVAAFTSRYGIGIVGYISEVYESINGNTVFHAIPDQHSTNFIDLWSGANKAASGVTTNIFVNVDTVYNAYNATGYELWYNGTDYQIYPLRDNGARLITPAGYTLVETVTAGNMPSVADSRMSTFKYALANSCILRNSVPEAYNTDDQATPKLLTYSELSALSANPKVTKTEADGKITNIKIK